MLAHFKESVGIEKATFEDTREQSEVTIAIY